MRNNIILLDETKANTNSGIHHSPPSIPSGDFKYGYKIDNDGYHMLSLKMLDNSEKIKPE